MPRTIHAGQFLFQMVEARVNAPLGHSQKLGEFKVGRCRRHRGLLATEACQSAPIERGPSFMHRPPFRIGLSPRIILGKKATVEGLAALFHQHLTPTPPLVGGNLQPLLARLQPAELHSGLVADGLKMLLVEPGRGFEG